MKFSFLNKIFFSYLSKKETIVCLIIKKMGVVCQRAQHKLCVLEPEGMSNLPIQGKKVGNIYCLDYMEMEL